MEYENHINAHEYCNFSKYDTPTEKYNRAEIEITICSKFIRNDYPLNRVPILA